MQVSPLRIRQGEFFGRDDTVGMMEERMRRWVAVLVEMVSVSAAAWAMDKPFNPASDPAKDLRAAMQRAQAEHKNILMDVGGNWCGWCLVLEETLHGDAELSALLEKNYV